MRAKNYQDNVGNKIYNTLPSLYADIWLLMSDIGIRVGDAVCIRGRDIDKDGYLHFTASKTGKKARLKLSEDVLSAIRGRIRDDDSYVFPSPSVIGEHISRQAVWYNIKKACIKCGIPSEGISPHSCRKHFAVSVYDKDGLSVAMSKLQHNSPNTTYLYLYDENPIEYLRKRLDSTEKQLKSLKKSLKDVLYVVNLCCDKLIGDDKYIITNEGRKAIGVDLSELDGNII